MSGRNHHHIVLSPLEIEWLQTDPACLRRVAQMRDSKAAECDAAGERRTSGVHAQRAENLRKVADRRESRHE